MKKLLLAFILLGAVAAKAQKVDSIFVNLYTDSLKKGTHNYINIDGLMSNGTYLPLDSNYINLWSDNGHFEGNDLVIADSPGYKKVKIKVTLKDDPKVCRDFVVHIKQQEDPPLPSQQQILDAMKADRKNNKNKN